MNHRSTPNQRILDKFVDREIIMQASSLVSDLMEVGKLSWDEVENLYSYECINEDCNGEELEGNSTGGYQCPNCGCITHAPEEDGMEGTPKDILEWWFVTEWFYEKLKEQGEAVMDTDYGYLWGRTTSGQAIALDYVVEKIAEKAEILEGQQYEWEA